MAIRKTQRTILFTQSLFRKLEKHRNAINNSRSGKTPFGYGKTVQVLAEKGLEYIKLERAVDDFSALVITGAKAVEEHKRWQAAGPSLLQFIKENRLEGDLLSYLEENRQTGEANFLFQLATQYGHAPGFAYPEKRSQGNEQEAKA